jgi:hypothetical protein
LAAPREMASPALPGICLRAASCSSWCKA